MFTRGSTVVVLSLCALSFLAGRFVQQSNELPVASEALPLQTGRKTLAAAMHQQEQIQGDGAQAVTQPATSSVDPLDPAQFEQFALEKSGLLQVRPPLPAAVSGDNFYHALPFQILSWAPRIVVFPAFVDKARCQHIVELAERMLYPSGLAYGPGEKVDPNQQTRTSKGTFLSASMDNAGVLSWVEERIAAASLIPRENGEAFNVLKYENSQHYDSHMDTFDPKVFGPQPSQRIATVLIYLSDVEEGGETVFKREGYGGEKRPITDWRSCDDSSFKYKPRMGDAVLFWSVTPDGEIDERALHGGCPVKNGTKWVMTKWLRSKGGRPEMVTWPDGLSHSREVLVWSGASSTLVRDARCKPFVLGHSGATRFIFIPKVAPAMSPAMVPCVPAPFDVAVRGEDDLELLGSLLDDAASPSFSEACAFLLNFNVDAALCQPPSPPRGTAGHCSSVARSRSYSVEGGPMSASCEQPRTLFDHGLFSSGTPANFGKGPPTAATPWHPGSLPPRARRAPPSHTKLSLNSSVKGGVTKKTSCATMPTKAMPFCIVKSGSRTGGATLQDLNASILQMAQQAGLC